MEAVRRAVIMAAGEGSRMRPLTLYSPKPLLEVRELSILDRTLQSLPDSIEEAVIVIGYRGKDIVEHLGNNYRLDNRDLEIDFVEQKVANGTGGALWKCWEAGVLRGQKGGDEVERFLLLNGDTLYRKADLEELIKYSNAILAVKLDDPEQLKEHGVLTIGADNRLVGIVEKPAEPPSKLINAGAYALTGEIFKYEREKLGKNGNGQMELGFINILPKLTDMRVVVAEYRLHFSRKEDLMVGDAEWRRMGYR